VLYDAFGKDATMIKDWGYAALVEINGKRILFDTGDDSAIFEKNVKAAKINPHIHFVAGGFHLRFDSRRFNNGARRTDSSRWRYAEPASSQPGADLHQSVGGLPVKTAN
jgi:metal-dependent hydrolase (beta-lactamase superfamily II)